MKFEINEKIYHFPGTWTEVSYEKYIKILKLRKRTAGKMNIWVQAEILSILSGCPLEDIKSLDAASFKILVEEFAKLLEYEAMENSLNSFRLKLYGKEFYFEPNVFNITLNEKLFIDDKLSAENSEDNLHLLAATFFREIKTVKNKYSKFKMFWNFLRKNKLKQEEIIETHPFNIDRINVNADIIKKYGNAGMFIFCLSFFLFLINTSMDIIKTCSQEELFKMINQNKLHNQIQ